jgi:hypothetical protein
MSSGGANPPAPPWDEQGRTQLSENPSGEAEREYFKSDEEKESDRLYNLSYQQDIQQRKKYAIRSYRITLIWVIFLISVSVSQLALKGIAGRGLEQAEFITVVTTTTGSVFGFWWLVDSYLFPSQRGRPSVPSRPPRSER